MLVNDDAHGCQGAEDGRRFTRLRWTDTPDTGQCRSQDGGQLHPPLPGFLTSLARGAEEEKRLEAKVYGLIANQPEVLAMSLERWLAHPLNRVPEQFAMAPPDADSNDRAIAALVGDHVPGAAFDLDVDAIR
ncbi:hypothetical protein [Pseudomonas chlororaphis]|uniref:hypothetical protein n=1 Tax=Pseudomonas chlororaphis TaxID=587753 RepID=UPI00209EA5BA|nr:hypothetical protein [Pseudomonas chlororaphis]